MVGSFRRSRGFTLVEIIVVLAIIMILAAIIFPVYETTMKRAEGTSCVCNLRNLGLAARLYSDDYDDQIVPASLGGPPGYFGTCWDVSIQPYLRNRGILICPSDDNPATSVPGRVSLPHSYGINFALAFVGGYNGSSMRMGQIDEPAQTILFMELLGNYRTFGVLYDDDGLEKVAQDRHDGGSNYAFADGHAKWFKPERTVDPDNLWDV